MEAFNLIVSVVAAMLTGLAVIRLGDATADTMIIVVFVVYFGTHSILCHLEKNNKGEQ